jgi:hypothetical protein
MSRNRVVGLVVGVVAMIGTVAVVAVAGASTPNITTAETLHLLARGGTSSFVDTGKVGPSIGDEVILNQPLYWASDPDQRAGTGHVIVTLEGQNASQDRAVLVLGNGQVAVDGFQGANSFALGVTGGTDEFQNARGQAWVALGLHHTSSITLSLIP